jgi:hypothetical protein
LLFEVGNALRDIVWHRVFSYIFGEVIRGMIFLACELRKGR